MRRKKGNPLASTRSARYRYEFIKAHPPRPYETPRGGVWGYRCRYCGRIISKASMQVDHLIPVSRAAYGPVARGRLLRQGIDDVNDIRNLVPSCVTCNARKGSKMGAWYQTGKKERKHPVLFRHAVGFLYAAARLALAFGITVLVIMTESAIMRW